jgi:uncharacterized protein YuzE
MRVTYDPSVDAVYIYLVDDILPGEVFRTYPCDPKKVNGEINLDFDSDGRLLGIEILDASRKLPQTCLRSVERI